jgi:hypothetical protein
MYLESDTPLVMTAPSAHDALGIAGFTFADLHQPARLRALYELFSEDVRRTDADLWAQWDAYRLNPASVTGVPRSNLIVAMAPHVSRFLARLFSVGPDADAMAAQTHAYDDLFRFKIDFVRRRALPLLKGGAPVEATAEDHAYVEQFIGAHADDGARELALAHAGCQLLDRDEAARVSSSDEEKQAVTAEIDRLKRWCAAHVHHPRYRDWVIFRFPETLDPMHLVHVVRPNAALPEAMVGTGGGTAPPRRLQAHRRALQHARSAERDPLLRALPRA